MRLVLTTFAVAWGVFFASTGVSQSQMTHDVVGTSDNTWKYKGKESPEAAVGKADGRLVIKAKNGDIVIFKVEGGRHGVLFETGADELKSGVWEVVPADGKKKLLPAKGLGKAYDPQKALMTTTATKGNELIRIRITNLNNKSVILLGCNPHSKSDDGKEVEMLAVIVLD